MAIIKISELPAADSPVSPSDVLPALQDGVTKKAAIDQFGFLPAGTSAITRTIQNKLRDIVSVKDFGAVGDGVTDDTNAIRACIAAASAAVQAGTGGIYGPVGSTAISSGSAPTVYFPNGVYKVTDYLTANTNQAVNYLQFVGENSIIVPSADTIRVFGGIGYMVTFAGLTFRGGAYAISLKSANVDTTTVKISNCEFINQVQYSVETDLTSNSTLLTIENCKFIMNDNTVPCGMLNLQTADFVSVTDCWVSGFTSTIPIVNKTQLWMKTVYCIPNTGLTHWIENYGSVFLDSCVFSGEDGGHPVVKNYAATDTTYAVGASQVKIVNCLTQSSTYIVELYELPNILWLEGTASNVDSLGIYFDSSLTNTDFFNWSVNGICNIQNNFVSGQYTPLFPVNNSTAGNLGYITMTAMMARSNQINMPVRSRFKSTEVYGSGGWGGGWSVNAVNSTVAFGTSPYGNGNAEITTTAAGGNAQILLGTYLNVAVLTAQTCYTMQIYVDVTAPKGCTVSINIGSVNKTFNIATGRHILSVPFVYWNNTGVANATYDTLNIDVNGKSSGDVIKLQRHTLFAGFMQSSKEILVMETSGAAPSAYTNGIGYDAGYYVGDMNWRTNPASAGPPGDVCTVLGNAGTWKAMANLA